MDPIIDSSDPVSPGPWTLWPLSVDSALYASTGDALARPSLGGVRRLLRSLVYRRGIAVNTQLGIPIKRSVR